MSQNPLLGNNTARQLRYGFREWYQDNRRRQIRSWGLLGAVVGIVVGKICRLHRLAHHVYGDHILLTEYSLDKENDGAFEALWNEQAKLTQRCEGYQGTKLFKVLNRDWACKEEVESKDSSVTDYRSTQSEDHGSCHLTETPPMLTQAQRFPFHYLQLRSWTSPEAEQRWRQNEAIQTIVTKLEALCWKVETHEYGTLADDKVKRLIW